MTWHRPVYIVVALAVALAGMTPPADACPVDSHTFHACCQPTVTKTETPSCCSEDPRHRPDPRSTTEVGCQCAHGAGVAAAMAAVASGQPDESCLVIGADSLGADPATPGDVGTVSLGVPDRGSGRSLFLLDCAFLI